jgi:hypothetical protein
MASHGQAERGPRMCIDAMEENRCYEKGIVSPVLVEKEKIDRCTSISNGSWLQDD